MTKKDALTLLKQDHVKVKSLLEDLVSTTDRAEKRRAELLEKIETEILVHTKLEEEIFYPAFREAADKKEQKKLFFEAVEEHHVADFELNALKDADPTSEVFGARAKVLKELIEHHIKEEEGEMFPHARKIMDSDQLEELGTRMEARKPELLKKHSFA